MQRLIAVLALFLGLAHIIFGIVVFKTLTLETFWFHGFGLAMIVTALANFRHDKIWILRLQNGLMVCFIWVLTFLAPQPQIFIGGLLFTGLFALSFLQKQKYS